MTEKRAGERERCFARVLLPEIATFGYMTDASTEGLRARFLGPVPRSFTGSEVMTIALEELGIGPFKIEAEYRWSRVEDDSSVFGFKMIACLGDEGRSSYEALLEWYRRDSHEDSNITVQ